MGVETIEMIVRSKDQAGNVYEMPPLPMHVDNLGPTIQLDLPCVLNQGCPMEIEDPGVGLAHIEILILGGSLGNETLMYGPQDVPDQIFWDGLLAGERAEPGEYLVTVRAWDQLGAMAVLVEDGLLSEPEVMEPLVTPAPSATPRPPLIPDTGEGKLVLDAPEVSPEQLSFDAFIRFMLDQPSTAILGGMILAYFLLFLGLAMVIRLMRSRV